MKFSALQDGLQHLAKAASVHPRGHETSGSTRRLQRPRNTQQNDLVTAPESSVSSPKEEALASLGHLLHSYSELQTKYTAQIHMPDCRLFLNAWETSLYDPIRREIRTGLHKRRCETSESLLYCAPGPHAPLIAEFNGQSVFPRLGQLTLADIDNEALVSARKRLSRPELAERVDAVQFDFTGPFGQRLCDTYAAALRLGKDAAEVGRLLARPYSLSSDIFHDGPEVLDQLCEKFAATVGGQRFSFLVSEMVASFTGTAVWLAFRSALYERFANSASMEELDNCLSAATRLWQHYNQLFVAFHLDLLRSQASDGGLILLIFDTCKVYDRPELASLPAIATHYAIFDELEAKRLRVLHKTTISWRDHPMAFDVRLYGIPVPDFQAHSHDVELYLLENKAALR